MAWVPLHHLELALALAAFRQCFEQGLAFIVYVQEQGIQRGLVEDMEARRQPPSERLAGTGNTPWTEAAWPSWDASWFLEDDCPDSRRRVLPTLRSPSCPAIASGLLWATGLAQAWPSPETKQKGAPAPGLQPLGLYLTFCLT